MKLIFATNNLHKIDEMRKAVGGKFELLTLKEAGIDIDIPEPHATLEANAGEKARVIYQLTATNQIAVGCFSEDTGLEVEALNGEPGVRSARYAGDDRSFEKNIDKVLNSLQGSANRKARFRAVICLIINGKENYFQGICNGIITDRKRGSGGFGYDPIFLPEGSEHTFAEMDPEEKNKFSHRRKAADKLVTFLKQLPLNTGI
jgi:XTP/dITP diphosphohydrolase